METEGKRPEAGEALELHDRALDNLWLPMTPRRAATAPGGLHIYVKGEGCRVTDIDGKSYIDGFAGLMYKNVGYGRKEIADAAYAQMLELTSPPQYDYATVPAVKLAAKLAQITPGSLSRTFLASGGSEANETAVKMAKHYQKLCDFGNRYKLIAREGEYHGFTHLTMNLGKPTGMVWAAYEPLVPGVRYVPQPYCYRCPLGLQYPDCGLLCARELERVIQAEGPEMVAAVIMTAISQQTPVNVPPSDYWPMIRSICDKYGVLLIDDEVVCGFGRTGKMFGIEHWGVVPDIMTMAKGLTSGYLPLAACISKSEVHSKFDEGRGFFFHIITFGGLPASCAAALANIEIIEREKLVERAATMGEYVSKRLQTLYEHSIVGDIRGIGLMWGVELVKDKKSKERLTPTEGRNLAAKLREAGLITRAEDGTIRFFPPLIITQDEIDESIAIMDKVIGELEKEFSAG